MADLDKKVKELEAENKSLRTQLEESTALNVALEEAMSTQTAELEKMKLAFEAASKGKRPVSLAHKDFEFEGQTYPFPGPSFLLAGFGKVTAEQALENPDILRALVELKAGNIN